MHRASLLFPVLSGVLTWLAFQKHKPGAIVLSLLIVNACVVSWNVGVRFSDELVTRKSAAAPFRVLELAQEATESHFFQVAAPPPVFFEWPGEGIVNGDDYNQYFGFASDYKGIDNCSEIHPDKLPALVVLNRETSKCFGSLISHCIPLFFLTASNLELCQITGSDPQRNIRY